MKQLIRQFIYSQLDSGVAGFSRTLKCHFFSVPCPNSLTNNKLSMKNFSPLKWSAFVLTNFCLIFSWSQETTFDYTGDYESYTVPPGVSAVRITAKGGQGASGDPGFIGGLGASMSGDFDVVPGSTLIIVVGGEGEGQGSGSNGGGGGGSFVVVEDPGSPYTISDGIFLGTDVSPLIIAGGGAGTRGSCAQNGNPGLTGENGGIGVTTATGGGGPSGIEVGYGGDFAPISYGSGGGGFIGDGGNDPAPGCGGLSFLNGASGGTDCGACGDNAAGGFGGGGQGRGCNGGGGGGGYTGGGGGWCAGGGGSYNDGTDQINIEGENFGEGQVIIEVLCFGLTITASEESICIGQEVTLTAVSDVGGEITWEGDIENGEPFIPVEEGLVEFTCTSDGEGDCDGAIIIAIWGYPDVEIEYEGPDPICFGDEITLSGDGASDYEWELDVEDGEPFVPEVGITDYTVIGTSGPGCQDIESITIEVFEAADISASVTDDEVCFGQSITLTGSGGESYVWSPEEIEDGVEYTPADAGTYTYYVTGTDGNGCTDQDSVEVFINEEIVITYTTIEEVLGGDGSIDITVTGGSPPYAFDWDNDGTGDYDDMEDLTDIAGGTYVVVVRDEVTCTESETIELGSQVGIDENSINVQIFPNPTSSAITITTNGVFNYELTTIDGEIVLRGAASNSALIDLNDLASGSYFVTVNANEKVSTSKIVKK